MTTITGTGKKLTSNFNHIEFSSVFFCCSPTKAGLPWHHYFKISNKKSDSHQRVSDTKCGSM